jgi:Na+/proline symporter/signal transduction histidine kinase/ActR/RegA family two-component response regulator
MAVIDGWTVVFAALAYVLALFAIAWLGDTWLRTRRSGGGRPLIYALSLAVYCTSWTFFGSVGLAAATGYDFLPVYVGPILLYLFGWRLVRRIVRLAKSQNITSVADFLAARYGKSQAVAAVVTLVVVAGTIPYIALQLKAVAISVETVVGRGSLADMLSGAGPTVDTGFIIAVAMALFAVLFGTRHIDATEHQEGLMLAIAAESVVKLAAFLTVGLFVVFVMFDGFGDLAARIAARSDVQFTFTRGFQGGQWLTVALLSAVCIVLLPRQFHVTVVECNTDREIERARWLFPLYLVAINLFVVPIAAAGLLLLPAASHDPDMFVLALPMLAEAPSIALLAFLGGLSAATAMVIVESVALAIMISNGLVVPLLIRRRPDVSHPARDMAPTLLEVRRYAILVVLLLGYLFYRALGQTQGLAAIGLLAFAAIAQLAPAFIGGLVWRKGTARGAIAGILAGFAVWAYTLLLPWVVRAGWLAPDILRDGLFGIAALKPQALFFLQFEPLPHGVLWSLTVNTLAYVMVSLLRAPEPIERLQAHVFVLEDVPRPPVATPFRLWRTSITVADLQQTVARYLGPERAERSFQEFAEGRGHPLRAGAEADIALIRFTEHLLASAIGAASARLVLSLLLRRSNVGSQTALRLLDDASEALQYNRDLLQSALDQVRHGLGVFDRDMRLICWNRQFGELLGLPPEVVRIGMPLDRILRSAAEQGHFGEGKIDDQVAERLVRFAEPNAAFLEVAEHGRRFLEVRTAPMPQGGVVATFSNITERVEAANALARANETLERRVAERTGELTEVNAALAIAKAQAEAASLGKTRFIAAASHDILQPLNAARLYAASLVERPLPAEAAAIARNVDASLAAVEEIFSALIEISRLDAGGMRAEPAAFALQPLLAQLQLEFSPLARERGLELDVVATTLWVRSDRRLLRRLLQNLLSNAIKYTATGRVLVGCRRRADTVVVQVFDTGPGIPADHHAAIFREFSRLDNTAGSVRGLGLGLSIVERIARVLEHRVLLASKVGAGSSFGVVIPRATPMATPSERVLPQGPRVAIAGRVCLCVDNEPQVLDGMRTLLESWGCRVLTAPDGVAAVDAVSHAGLVPDVILADYHLDQGSGLDVIAALRARYGPELAAVVITADHTPEVQALVRAADVHLLRKPVRTAALRALLMQITRRATLAAE